MTTSPDRMPAPLSGETVVPRGNGVLLIGGLDSSDVSVATITRFDPEAGTTKTAGSLSQPLHDAAAAVLGGRVVVFGGGAATTVDAIERLLPGGTGEVVGRLPAPSSDLSAVTVDGRAYVLGGYDGREALGTVLRTRDGSRLEPVTGLAVPVRYGAVVAHGPKIYVFGGEQTSGADSNAIQVLDTRSGAPRVVGHLPATLAHAAAVALGHRIYILGGRRNGSTTDQILRFDPRRGTAVAVGRLPEPIQNAAATTVGGVGYLIGGLTPGESAVASIVTLRLAAPAKHGRS